MTDKKEIRALIKQKKAELTAEEIERRSYVLAARLFDRIEYKEADTIYIYLSYNQEVMTEPIIERAFSDGKRVAVPKTIMRQSLSENYMEFIYINDETVFEVKKGIQEPVDGEIADTDALVIVPGLAFGKDMNRIGYGGGFYDKYFSAHKERKFFKVALCYDFQVFDTLDVEEHDEKIDVLIFE